MPQSVKIFAADPAFAEVGSVGDFAARLSELGIAHRPSSKSVCLLGNAAMSACCQELLGYYAALSERPLCLKVSRSQEFIGEHDVAYAASPASAGATRRAWARRAGSVRSKLAVGNILSLHGLTPRVLDVCVLQFPAGLRLIAQVCDYFPELVKDARRVRALCLRLQAALLAERISVVSRLGWKDADFSSRSNNFCGAVELRYVDTQKFAFDDLARETERVRGELERAQAAPSEGPEWLAALGLHARDIADRIVLDIGEPSFPLAAALLSQGARAYLNWCTSDPAGVRRLLYYEGYSRLACFEPVQALPPALVQHIGLLLYRADPALPQYAWCRQNLAAAKRYVVDRRAQEESPWRSAQSRP